MLPPDIEAAFLSARPAGAMAGRRSIHPRKSSAVIKVLRPLFRAINSPELIAW
jgi:hypothetical protein